MQGGRLRPIRVAVVLIAGHIREATSVGSCITGQAMQQGNYHGAGQLFVGTELGSAGSVHNSVVRQVVDGVPEFGTQATYVRIVGRVDRTDQGAETAYNDDCREEAGSFPHNIPPIKYYESLLTNKL